MTTRLEKDSPATAASPTTASPTTGNGGLHAMLAVARARLIEFIRQPEAVFWVYIFPLLMILVLGLAFRNQAPAALEFDIVDSEAGQRLYRQLESMSDLDIHLGSEADCRRRLRTGKTFVVVAPTPRQQIASNLADSPSVNASSATSEPQPAATDSDSVALEKLGLAGCRIEYWFDPTRPEAPGLKREIDNRLQRLAGRQDAFAPSDVTIQETGGRYIDFLVPGLIGMGLLGGGLWGVGFAIVDMRIRKLLKRFVATPMRRSDFLGGVMISRLSFMFPEIMLMLVFSWLLFDVRVQGSWWLLAGVVLLGAIQFSGIGLLVAARCKTLESASGLMNLVMLPMWTLCGIFFSWEKFPAATHPFIQCLPLTPVIDALRAVVNDGAGIAAIAPQLLVMAGWSVFSFAIALRIFRWRDS